MRIDPKDQIAGVGILKVRDFLRQTSDIDRWGVPLAADRLSISPEVANELVGELVQRGYVEPAVSQGKWQSYSNSVKGNALGLASAAKPITRKTADRVLSEFLDRVCQVNSDRSFLKMVRKVLVFGSYLSDASRINDIDLAVELVWKEDHPSVRGKERADVAFEHSCAAQDKGRHFGTLIDRMEWPENEVKLFLKSRSRALSIHPIEDGILDQTDTKVLFQEKELRRPECVKRREEEQGQSKLVEPRRRQPVTDTDDDVPF